MLSKKLTDELNSQINFEFYSAHVYLSIAAYCAKEDLPGACNFFMVQAEEEKFHAMKFFNYINERGERVILEGIPTPEIDFSSILDAFKVALAHEKMVTQRIYSLMDTAVEDREHATISFLRWFIDEQVEEEATFTSLVKKLQRIASDPSSLYALDDEMATRVFTPPTNA